MNEIKNVTESMCSKVDQREEQTGDLENMNTETTGLEEGN